MGEKSLGALSGQAQISRLEGRNDKYTEHRERSDFLNNCSH